MPDVFLSYSREDQVTARRFAEVLTREGFEVWWDQALDAGESFDKVTEQALRDASAVVVLWSKRSVDSKWVRSEATQADRFGKLVPVAIEPCDRPIMFELNHTADLSGWSGDATEGRWRVFIDGLRRTVGKTQGLAASATPTSTPTQTPGTVRASRTPSRTTITWTAIAALIAIGIGLYWHFYGGDARSPAKAAGSPATTRASVAVLPFRDMSQNKDQEYFADGVTEEILNSLAGLKDLKVTARTSAFAFKGKDVNLRAVGETLGVQHILEGSIRKDGETLRITAQLIDAKADAHLWSKTYDRPLKDIFLVQEDIARSVATALQVSLGVGFGAQQGMTRDLDAYDAYLRANAMWGLFTVESRRRGTDLLQQAVDRDPKFAFAWRALAEFCASMPGLEGGGPGAGNPQAWQKRSDDAFGKFERLMAGTPLLYWALAGRSIQAGRWAESARHYKEGAAVAARLGTPWEEVGGAVLLVYVGRPSEATVVLQRALARDPLNPTAALYSGLAYSAVGNVPASYAALEPSDQFPSERGVFLGTGVIVAMGAKDKVQVRRWLDRSIEAAGPATTLQLTIRARLDKPPEALAALRELVRDPSTPSWILGLAAEYLAYFGDAEDALQVLRSPRFGAPAGLGTVVIWGPVFRDMRKLPAFKDFVRDVGLVDYWREFGWSDFCKPEGDADFACS